MKLEFFEFFDKYTFVFSTIYTIITTVVGVIIAKVSVKIKQYKIRKCLSLTRNDCRIILPSYEKTLHNTTDIIPVCPIGDIKAASNIIDLINKTGLYTHQNSIFYEDTYNDNFDKYNIFCIGGSLANQYSYDIFKQFFPNFKILAPEEKIRTNPNGIPAEDFVMSNGERGFCWGNLPKQQYIINNDERYAIIVKLSNKDFDIKNHGTIHILFGNGLEGTLAISKYLLHDYKDLYKKVKRKRHYFIAFKVKRNTGIIDANSFVDLTEEMFVNNGK